MVKDLIIHDLSSAVTNLGFSVSDIVVSIPENAIYGDYTTNIALQLSKQKTEKGYQKGIEIANQILHQMGHPGYLERIEVAGPGFINFFVSDSNLVGILSHDTQGDIARYARRVLVEYAQPNTHKLFHIGHLRNVSLGESLARILECTGAEVFRVTYGSDIGLPVAKALWALMHMEPEYRAARNVSLSEKAAVLGRAYAFGHKQYEEGTDAKTEIDALNIKLYKKDAAILPLWEETKQWSIDYFRTLYDRLGTKFDAEIWESEVEAEGKQIVRDNLGKVFEEDEGAVIFPGERYRLHNRVFITSAGNPTYEAKELGLAEMEARLFPFDEAIHLTGNEQIGYFQVVFKAIEQVNPELADKKRHIAFGFVTLKNTKMSSRLGNILSAEQLVEEVENAILEKFPDMKQKHGGLKDLEKIAISAIKFSFLSYAVGSDISFDVDKSVSLQGDSGPYVQYTYARAKSVLGQAGNAKLAFESGISLEKEERDLLRILEYFAPIVDKARVNLAPNEICVYLLDLSRAFNLFYQNLPILKSKKEGFRLCLTQRVSETLKQGMHLLGIEMPDRM